MDPNVGSSTSDSMCQLPIAVSFVLLGGDLVDDTLCDIVLVVVELVPVDLEAVDVEVRADGEVVVVEVLVRIAVITSEMFADGDVTGTLRI